MGLSIHFNGTLSSSALITPLSTEVLDICNSLGWEWQHIQTTALNGIVFTPPECEPLFLSFTNEGRLFSPFQTEMEETYKKAGLHASMIYCSSVKTQYAGIAIHKVIIELFRYLSRTYFQHFELKDEGMYWETNDEAVLQAQFGACELALQTVTGAFAAMKRQAGESTNDLATRIEAVLKELRQKQSKQ